MDMQGCSKNIIQRWAKLKDQTPQWTETSYWTFLFFLWTQKADLPFPSPFRATPIPSPSPLALGLPRCPAWIGVYTSFCSPTWGSTLPSLPGLSFGFSSGESIQIGPLRSPSRTFCCPRHKLSKGMGGGGEGA